MRFRLYVFATLGLVASMAMLGTGAGAQAPEDAGAAQTETTSGEAVGASITHPAGWLVEREPYTEDGTYGFTLWRPETDRPHDHGGTPVVRVSRAFDLKPGQIESEVQETLAYYEGELSVRRTAVSVGERGHEGVAVGPIPGSTPSFEVYVPVNGRVYLINVYAQEPGEEGLDPADEEMLSGISFDSTFRTVSSLGLPAANSPEALYPSAAEQREVELQRDEKDPNALRESTDGSLDDASLATRSGGGEMRIAEGCWRANPRFFVQNQHGSKANGSRSDGIPTGWTHIGLPNFWGQYTHGNLGYGRCNEPYYTNDKFAVDYPLNKWDYVFSPFGCGRVTHAGRNKSHADYGIFVSIRACNGKYVNLTGHLTALRNGLSRGDKVNRDTVIGYAGKTGGSVPVGRVHIHTAFYRYPKVNPDGSPYGGAGLQIVRNRYVGTAARKRGLNVSSHVYNYARVRPQAIFCREGRNCGERYLVSN